MNVSISNASESDAAALSQLHMSVAEDLTQKFGPGPWSQSQSERGILVLLRRPHFVKILTARTRDGCIVASLCLATKKPWAIDVRYFTAVPKALYLTGMSVHPKVQRKGIGRSLLAEAAAVARNWPANSIRLDAFDAAAGAEGFYAKCGYREVARVSYKQNPLVYFENLLA